MPTSYSLKTLEAMRDSFVTSLIDASPLRMRIFRSPYDLVAEVPCTMVLPSVRIVADEPSGVTTNVACVVVVGAKGQFLVGFSVDPPQVCVGDSIAFDFEMLELEASNA